MVLEEVVDPQTIENLINQISNLTTFIQALGGVIVIYLVFNIINIIISRKKNKELNKINENLEQIKELLRKKNK
jgi:lysylphosphatidylglycerol synthetase-like protein (DUF2156 family)